MDRQSLGRYWVFCSCYRLCKLISSGGLGAPPPAPARGSPDGPGSSVGSWDGRSVPTPASFTSFLLGWRLRFEPTLLPPSIPVSHSSVASSRHLLLFGAPGSYGIISILTPCSCRLACPLWVWFQQVPLRGAGRAVGALVTPLLSSVMGRRAGVPLLVGCLRVCSWTWVLARSWKNVGWGLCVVVGS